MREASLNYQGKADGAKEETVLQVTTNKMLLKIVCYSARLANKLKVLTSSLSNFQLEIKDYSCYSLIMYLGSLTQTKKVNKTYYAVSQESMLYIGKTKI